MLFLKMSLFYFLTNSFTLWPDAYECPEELNKPGTRSPIFGIYLIVSGTGFLMMYIPCFIAMIMHNRKTPAIKLMLMLAAVDIPALTLNSLIIGVLSYNGTSYCQYPKFFFICGCVACCTWMTGCLTAVLLAIERCVEVKENHPFQVLFGKRVFSIVLKLVLVYEMYTLVFVKPVLFNPEYNTVIFDPLIGKNATLYENRVISINNIFVTTSTITLCIYLCYQLLFKYGYSTSMWLYKSKRQIVLQGIILCLFHATVGVIYDYMEYVSAPKWLMLVGHLFWQWSTGCFSIVYLTLNRTIRDAVLKLLIPKKIREKWGLHIGVEEHQAVERAAEAAEATVNPAGVVVKFDNYFC